MKLLNKIKYSILFAVLLCGFKNSSNAQVVVSGSTGADATYASLTNAAGAFDLINSTAQTGNNIVITITADVTTEAGTISLNNGTWTTLTINPTGGATRTIAGAVAGPILNLNGAKNVTIDGLNSGGNSLVISNTLVGASSTVRFIADASSNTIKNCTIEGSTTSATLGTILFLTGTTTGNDNNVITLNTITSAGVNYPVNAIYSAGTSGAIDNSGITITNNNIQDYFSNVANTAGIHVASNSSAWTIIGNKFFQTGDRTLGAFTTHAIRIITASGVNYNISNNTIGYANAVGTGTTNYVGTAAGLFRGIEMTVGTTTVSNVQGNSISGISFASSSNNATAPGIFTGISILAGAVNVGTLTGNTIGASTGTGSIQIASTVSNGYVAGIYATSTNTINIQNNIIGAIKTDGGITIGNTFHGINTAGTLGNFTINNNTLGSLTTANSISIGLVGATTSVNGFNGITNAATGTVAINGNTVQNCSAYGSAVSNSVFRGINNTATVTTTLTISLNNVNAGFCSGSSLLAGISNTGNAATANIFKNKVCDLHKEGNAGILSGLLITNGTTVNIYNNYIGDLRGPISSGGDAIRGINITSTGAVTTYNVNYNTIYLNATSNQSVFGSSGVFHAATNLSTSATLNLINNLVVNLSTPGTGGGEVVALRRGTGGVNGALGVNYGASSNNNSFYAGVPGPKRLIFSDNINADQTLADFKLRVAPSDAASITVNPDFISTVGSNPGFLHLVAAGNCALESAGAALTGDDFDGDVRSATPDIGADEFVSAGSPLPALPTVSGTVTICSGNTTTLTAIGLPEATFAWYDMAVGGTLLASTAAFTTPVLTSATNYYVEQTTCAGTSATRTAVTVNINNVPAAAGAISGTGSPLCQSQTGVAFSTGTIAGATGYTWAYTGTGFSVASGTGTSLITADFASATAGNLTVTGTNSCGSGVASPAFAVSFNTPPTIANAGPDQSGCGPTATLAANSPTSGSGMWTVVSGSATIVAPSSPTSGVTGLSTNGSSVTLRWTISNGTCSTSSDEVRIACPPHELNSCSSCHMTHNNPLGDRELVMGNANGCISCHNPTGVAHQRAINNSMKATPNVKGTSHSWDKAAVNALYEANAPFESDMASNLPSGKIICSTCHDQHDDSKTGSPYLRGYATANDLCKDCHSPRNVGSYNTNPTANKGSHPVGGFYPSSDPKYKVTPTGSVALIAGKVECTSCHMAHNAATNDGNLLRQTNNNNLCKECHTYGSHNGQGCNACHSAHNNNKNNILLTKNNIETPNSGFKPMVFTSRTGANSFADGDATFNGVCEVCHTTTVYHRNDGTGLANHKNGTNCTSCHSHSNNFSAPTCGSTSCHPTSGGAFGAEGAHATHTQRYGYSCSTCHFQRGTQTAFHLNGSVDINFNPNGLATRNGLDANTPTYNAVSKTCSDVYCHSNGRSAYRGTDGVYTWSSTIGSQPATYKTTPAWSATFSATSCNSVDGCHDAMLNYPIPVGPTYNLTVPGPLPNLGNAVAGNYQPATGAHRTANHTDNDRNWSPGILGTTTWSTVLCFTCHNTDGVPQDSPNKMGTYGTSYHVDGQTFFKPGQFPRGTEAPWNERAYDGENAHCGNSSKCW